MKSTQSKPDKIVRALSKGQGVGYAICGAVLAYAFYNVYQICAGQADQITSCLQGVLCNVGSRLAGNYQQLNDQLTQWQIGEAVSVIVLILSIILVLYGIFKALR